MLVPMERKSRPFRFAVQGGPFRDPDALVAYAREIEQMGYDELYSSDHLGGVDPFAPLVVAAAATHRLRVGPLVLNNEFHHPALLARTAASVDQMTSGRLVLGVGTGYATDEHTAMNLRLLPPGERVTRFGESLAVLRDLLDTGACHFAGAHHQIAIEDLGLRPTQHRVPILVGGHGRRVVSLAAEYADIFQFTGLVTAPDGTMSCDGFSIESVAQRADWLAEAAGDRDGHIERSSLVQAVAVGGDVPTTAELAARFELDEAVLADTPFVLVGSVEQIVDKVQSLRERSGISHYVIRDAEAFAPVVAMLQGR
jgi:probable F420-dependent oxidoreductase